MLTIGAAPYFSPIGVCAQLNVVLHGLRGLIPFVQRILQMQTKFHILEKWLVSVNEHYAIDDVIYTIRNARFI